VAATGPNRVGRTNVERWAPMGTLSTGAMSGALALASGTFSTSGLSTAIAEGALLMTAVGGCTTVNRHGAMGAMICSGVLPLVPDTGTDAGGAVGGAVGGAAGGAAGME
jgi:hypothetical protein